MTQILAGKRTLVTGGSRGIGRAIAVEMAAAGAQVLFTYARSPSEANETLRQVAEAGGAAKFAKTNVASEKEILDLFNVIDVEWGGLDIVINNAGVIIEKGVVETTADDFDRLMDINLRGTFLVGREALRRMARQESGGRLINISSDLGSIGRESYSVYAASKGAINALTKSWALEFAPKILVNAIAPGPIETDMLNLENMSPEWREKEEDIPLQRVGQPEEISGLAVFLAGPQATFITGQIIGANGGSVMP